MPVTGLTRTVHVLKASGTGSGSEPRLPERGLELDERLAERLAQERLVQRMAEMERT